ncbi:MAG: helix-turn-helix domain-containing protein [Methanobacteriaceae archaeon]|nr:helix-turn-helix domain-containing protein [Methanobacteriaceae archaeon]
MTNQSIDFLGVKIEKKELQIINAPLKLFSEKGLHGTSTAEIAKSAKVDKEHYFTILKVKNH